MPGHESLKLSEAGLRPVPSELRLPRRRIDKVRPRVVACPHWYGIRVIYDGDLYVEVLSLLRGSRVVGARLLSPVAEID